MAYDPVYNVSVTTQTDAPFKVIKPQSEFPDDPNKAYIDPEVWYSRETLLQYRSRRRAWALQAQEDNDFRLGAQWTVAEQKELKRKKQLPIVVNILHPAIESAKASLTANSPRFIAVGREVSDNRVAAAASDLLTYVWDKSEGTMQFRKFVDDRYVEGMGVIMVYVDYHKNMGKGEVMFKMLDPLDIYVDPNSKDFFCRDAANILFAKVFTYEQITQMWPEYEEVLAYAQRTQEGTLATVSETLGLEAQGSANKPVDRYHNKYEYIDRYTKVSVDVYNVYDPESGMEKTFDEKKKYEEFLDSPAVIEVNSQGNRRYILDDVPVKEALSIASQTGGQFHYAINPQDQNAQPQMIPGAEDPQADAKVGLKTIPQSTITILVITQRKAMEDGKLEVETRTATRIKRVMSIGGVKVFQEQMQLEEYPIIISMTNHDRTPFPTSPVRLVRPLQQYINKIRSLIVAHAANSTNLKVFLPRGGGQPDEIRAELEKPGVGLVFYDAEVGEPHFGQPIPLPNELYKNEADARHDVQEILGVYTVSQGDPTVAPSTYKGTVAIDEFGQRRMKSQREEVEAALAYMGQIIWTLCQQVYTDEKVIRIVGPNHEQKSTVLNRPIFDDYSKDMIGKINDITVGKYDLKVIAGSTQPVNRWARFEYYKEMLQLGAIDREEFLKQTEIVDIEGVLERTSEIVQLQQALAQAQEQIKQLSGDLQTATRESQHDRKRVEIEKFKSTLADQKAKMGAASDLFTARLGDELTKRKVQTKAVAARKGANGTGE